MECAGDDLLGTDSEDSEDESLLPSSSQHFRDLMKRANECDQTQEESEEADGSFVSVIIWLLYRMFYFVACLLPWLREKACIS